MLPQCPIVGDYARCHSSRNYPPCLQVIGLLTIRAALHCGYYDDEAISELATKVMGDKDVDRNKWLSDKLQPKSITQEWLCILGDRVLPLLVKNHEGDGRDPNVTWHMDEDRRTFTIIFPGKWEKLFSGYHNLIQGQQGALSDELIELNKRLGDCGDDIGRRQHCVVNAFQRDACTVIEFAVTK